MGINENLDTQVRLSAQRALLGHVPPSLRSVSVDIDDQQIYLRCIFDGTPTECHLELMSITASEIIANFAAPYMIEEEYLSIKEPIRMNYLKHLIYRRYENQYA